MTIGVLGAGSFGTALAVVEGAAGRDVVLWARRPELAEDLGRTRVNPEYLGGDGEPPRLPPPVTVTSDLAALAACEVVLAAVPSHGYREVLRRFLRVLPATASPAVVSAIKGIETDTLARISEVTFEEAVKADREVRFAALGGPCFAAELAAGTPSASVIACRDAELAARLRDRLATPTFRLYSTTDVTGVEIGGTAKNVVAIAAGVVSGLGLGHNTLAVLMTRGLHEISRLALASGGRSRTLAGLAGLGDLVLTCTGGPSRNRRLGTELAAGRSLEEISGSTSMVFEGVRSSLAVVRLAARQRVEMPIAEQVVAVLYHGRSPRDAIEALMSRELKSEPEL
ncbi:MAG: NAD(P)-dependent glycerol-3-phosphate dehydrogenase [Acidobacteria bacterium]|nr:MAG: NAD(P)-dependent glycerol-3-phosphate dehydrogenase [Acidobacteriota bacterium]